MDWSLDLGPMNIWCEFEENLLKTLLCCGIIHVYPSVQVGSGYTRTYCGSETRYVNVSVRIIGFCPQYTHRRGSHR